MRGVDAVPADLAIPARRPHGRRVRAHGAPCRGSRDIASTRCARRIRIRLRVPGADAKVAVEGAGSLVADLDDPRLAVLAPNSDLPLPQVQIATLRVVGVEADAREFGQPDAGRFSGGCAGPGKSTSAACAASMPLRSVRESRIVAAFPEPFVSTLLARSHNSMSVAAGGVATSAWSD